MSKRKSRFINNSTGENADSSLGSLSQNISKAVTENRLDIRVSDKRTSVFYRDFDEDQHAGVIFKEEYESSARNKRNPFEKKKHTLERMKDNIASRALLASNKPGDSPQEPEKPEEEIPFEKEGTDEKPIVVRYKKVKRILKLKNLLKGEDKQTFIPCRNNNHDTDIDDFAPGDVLEALESALAERLYA